MNVPRLLCGLLIAAALASPVNTTSASLRDLRYDRMIGQTTWYTCGPAAAVATLLTHCFDLQVNEAAALELALETMERDGGVPESGVTALALKSSIERHGIETRGYRVTLDALADYFERGGLPVILHVTRPQLHHVLAEGLVAGQRVIADPPFGRRLLPLAALEEEKGFSGLILVTLPGAELADKAVIAQQRTLAWTHERLARLNTLRSPFR